MDDASQHQAAAINTYDETGRRVTDLVCQLVAESGLPPDIVWRYVEEHAGRAQVTHGEPPR